MVKRPSQLAPRAPLTVEQIQTTRYVGSPEHKVKRWWGGLPEAHVDTDGVARRPWKQLTTICPLVSDAERQMATDWVQQALRLDSCVTMKAIGIFLSGCGTVILMVRFGSDFA